MEWEQSGYLWALRISCALQRDSVALFEVQVYSEEAYKRGQIEINWQKLMLV